MDPKEAGETLAYKSVNQTESPRPLPPSLELVTRNPWEDHIYFQFCSPSLFHPVLLQIAKRRSREIS